MQNAILPVIPLIEKYTALFHGATMRELHNELIYVVWKREHTLNGMGDVLFELATIDFFELRLRFWMMAIDEVINEHPLGHNAMILL